MNKFGLLKTMKHFGMYVRGDKTVPIPVDFIVPPNMQKGTSAPTFFPILASSHFESLVSKILLII